MPFLKGLIEIFAQIRSQVLMMDPLPPINKVLPLVIQEERQRNIRSRSYLSSVEPMAFGSNSSASSDSSDGSKQEEIKFFALTRELLVIPRISASRFMVIYLVLSQIIRIKLPS